MGTIDQTDIGRRLDDHHKRISTLETSVAVIEREVVHAEDQRNDMQDTLKSVQSGVTKIDHALHQHAMEEAKDRNKLQWWVITTLVSVLIALALLFIKSGVAS